MLPGPGLTPSAGNCWELQFGGCHQPERPWACLEEGLEGPRVFRARKTSQAGKSASSCEEGAPRSYHQWLEANIKLLQRTGVKFFDWEELGFILVLSQHQGSVLTIPSPLMCLSNTRNRQRKGRNQMFIFKNPVQSCPA